MTTYAAPIRDIRFVLENLCALEDVSALPGLEEAAPDLVFAVLDEADKFASGVLAPLNQQGDHQGSRLVDGAVRTPEGWRDAYASFAEGGWNGAVFDVEYGGMGLPWLVNAAIQEMMHAANMAFALCPMLTQGAIEALVFNASDDLKARYLPKMVSGEWTGTMNLTEAGAGSDLGAVRTRAERSGDHYLISGQKIFITYGDHDLTENIIHLVLARTPDAPPGVKGISLFAVPKMMAGENGTPGKPNDVACVSLEHKLGIHASPTAVLAFGDHGGAVGYLVGEENRGLEYMFVMMNMARLVVGIQGLGVSERAYQQALQYARERIQGPPAGTDPKQRLPIFDHPDVRRMLMTMKAYTEAMRAVALTAARSIDFAHRDTDAARKAYHQGRADLLTPIVKGWLTEMSVELTSLAVQVHGGMGYVEETGVAQHFRDARITTIYEGTTAIQANDLVGRKIIRDKGKAVGVLLDEMRQLDSELATNANAACAAMRGPLASSIDALAKVVDWLLGDASRDPRLPAGAACNVLKMAGIVIGGYQMARAAVSARGRLDAGDGDPRFLEAKIATATFYAEQILPQAGALLPIIVDGTSSIMALQDDQF
ncbi:MAG: acyl-CoA dehydrogenase [Rhodospirillales bacterium]|nr:acyl-CoA dehydrogenase [Rhodospirillales bacterium]